MLVTANGLSRGAVDMGKPVQVRVDQDPMDRRRGDPEPARELDRSFAQAQAELDATPGRGLAGLVRRPVGP